MPAALRLTLSTDALVANYRWFAEAAGVPVTAAVKADGYGLGARDVVARLAAAGARAFAVSSWAEAAALGVLPEGCTLLVLHGFSRCDAADAAAMPWARPVLNTPAQCAAWRAAFPARACDVMVETGMNRLGLGDLAAMEGLAVDTVHSHLACADEPGHPLTARQLQAFRALATATPDARHMLANSAGVCIGRDYAFDGVRPGLGLYGGIPRAEAVGGIAPVVALSARVIQLSAVRDGDTVGYGATWVAVGSRQVATLNVGYADGLPRGVAARLRWRAGDRWCPTVGRISMDMTAVDVTGAGVAEGDWLTADFDLATLAADGPVSQYELLTGLGHRYERRWT
ncbi:alanine racemase [Sandaracinobacteroides saxicola]|uniref:alanine racemase n=1 Tax=Sandaracinobacteroides saxicola TaxID=2759707 RepID=A0A7G5IG40_9SPHN|nr:alanine racemase [Sandaracinobacteroides saxicola]QMW22332.1 alanine racemase [Sandaracinobacteroides saxicola]